MIKRLLGITFIILTIYGCVSTKNSNGSINFNNEEGLILATVTFNHNKKKSPYDTYRFHLKDLNRNDSVSNSSFFTINVNFFNGRYNGQLNDNKTYPIILKKQFGDYEFNGFWFTWNGGIIKKEYINPVLFQLPFKLDKSEIIYIGEIIINVNSKENPYIIINDNFEKDIEYFKRKYLNINFDNVINRTLKSGNTGEGFVKIN